MWDFAMPSRKQKKQEKKKKKKKKRENLKQNKIVPPWLLWGFLTWIQIIWNFKIQVALSSKHSHVWIFGCRNYSLSGQKNTPPRSVTRSLINPLTTRLSLPPSHSSPPPKKKAFLTVKANFWLRWRWVSLGLLKSPFFSFLLSG